ncbi:MAG: YfhO family protein, partial [Ferruginibacter sp.]|nr:YfhO family protein [Chitinophagaceae bacterium]
PKYWGALPYTAGPAYLGVFIFILGLIGFVIIKTPLRWGLLAATLFGILISWGKNFAVFNTFLFEHLPMYNKFRAPSMAQVIPQFTIGVVAVLALQQLLFAEKSRELLKTDFKKILYAVGGLFALLAIMYVMMEYSSVGDPYSSSRLKSMGADDELARTAIAGMKADRQAMFGGQLLRAAAFGLLLLGTLYLYMKNRIKPMLATIALLVISTLELTMVSKKYLAEENYVTPDDYTSTNFTATAIDQQILKDKDPNFRVFNMAGDTYNESRTSYFHKSVGGYHPAKLRIYQDVIEKYLSGRPNPGILNMLNTKYIVIQDPQSGQPGLIPNPDVFGPCWLVKYVKVVENRVEAIQSIGTTNLKDTAIVDKTFSKNIVQPQWDSASSVKMIKFDNDAIEYEANCTGPQFAVFSEVYYPVGWNAYLDGKKTDYANVNYILRGLSLPAGKHSIKFVFEPASVKKGVSIMFVASIIILLVFAGGLFMHFRREMQSGDRKSSGGKSYGKDIA